MHRNETAEERSLRLQRAAHEWFRELRQGPSTSSIQTDRSYDRLGTSRPAPNARDPERWNNVAESSSHVAARTTCPVCLEDITRLATSIRGLRSIDGVGYTLPCPRAHRVCVKCIRIYIMQCFSGRQPSPDATVFPIPCPGGCSLQDWPSGIPDTVATAILLPEMLAIWNDFRFIENLQVMYCPWERCGGAFERYMIRDGPHECAECGRPVCLECNSKWHKGMSCETFQSLPQGQRDDGDRAVQDLALRNGWQRCPHCGVIVSKAEGCPHMTCRCGASFCYQCGAFWNLASGRCSQGAACRSTARTGADIPLRRNDPVPGDAGYYAGAGPPYIPAPPIPPFDPPFAPESSPPPIIPFIPPMPPPRGHPSFAHQIPPFAPQNLPFAAETPGPTSYIPAPEIPPFAHPMTPPSSAEYQQHHRDNPHWTRLPWGQGAPGSFASQPGW